MGQRKEFNFSNYSNFMLGVTGPNVSNTKFLLGTHRKLTQFKNFYFSKIHLRHVRAQQMAELCSVTITKYYHSKIWGKKVYPSSHNTMQNYTNERLVGFLLTVKSGIRFQGH